MTTIQELFDLHGRVAIVAGGTGLLGPSVIEALADAGAEVVVVSRQLDRATSLVERLTTPDRRLIAAEADARDPASVERVVDETVKRTGRLDIMVAAVSGGSAGLPEDLTPEAWQEGIAANLHAVFYLCQAAGRQMLRQGGGSIITFGSIYGVVSPYRHVYAAGEIPRNPVTYGVAKAGVIHLTRYLATSWADRSVRVNCISPGGTWASDEGREDFAVRYRAMTPDGRSGRPDDLQGAIVYLASDASAHVTGSNLMVDGGWTIW